MATLREIKFYPHRVQVSDSEVHRTPLAECGFTKLPTIIWKAGSPWRAVNSWLYERAFEVSGKTVLSLASALQAYAQWLEESTTDWREFPARKADRCIVRYRGHLIRARDDGRLAPSTTSQRMRAVVRFYRWLEGTTILTSEMLTPQERTVRVYRPDASGFSRTILVQSTDLAIPNRTRIGESLEGNLLPIASEDRDSLLSFIKRRGSTELHLMLCLGFFTGMRIGSICDLKVNTLLRAIRDPTTPNAHRIGVGPGATPAVATKFGITGQVWLIDAVLKSLLEYAYSSRRMSRVKKADVSRKDLLFLTKAGRSYVENGDRSKAINVEMHRLRRNAKTEGLSFDGFKFHQSRATFATEIARIALTNGDARTALSLVKHLLLHAHEATSLRYIRFVERTPAKIAAENAFAGTFLGILNGGLPKTI